MFINIEALFFNALFYAQPMNLLDAVEQNEATDGSPEIDDQNAKALGTEESPAVTIKSTICCG